MSAVFSHETITTAINTKNTVFVEFMTFSVQSFFNRIYYHSISKVSLLPARCGLALFPGRPVRGIGSDPTPT